MFRVGGYLPSSFLRRLSFILGSVVVCVIFGGPNLHRPQAMPSKHKDVTVLKNKAGIEVHILSVGAIIQKLLVPDKDGNLADIALGFDEIAPYKVSFI